MQHNHKTATYQSLRYQRPSSGNGLGHLLLFYILPFIVFNSILFYCVTSRPKVSLELADTNDYLTTQATMQIKSWFPVKSMEVNLEGEAVEMEKTKGKTYVIPLYKNGVLEVRVENLNGMSTTLFEHVNILDDNPPSIEDTAILDGVVTLTVTDSQSGVNFDSIYATNSAGERVEPLTVDRATCTLSYEMDPSGLHVFAQDKAQNQVQATFTSHKEGDTETLDGGVLDGEEGAGAEAGGETAGANAA